MSEWFAVYVEQFTGQTVLGKDEIGATILTNLINQHWGRSAVQVFKTSLPGLYKVLIYPRAQAHLRMAANACGFTNPSDLKKTRENAVTDVIGRTHAELKALAFELTGIVDPFKVTTAGVEDSKLIILYQGGLVEIQLPETWPVG